MAQFQHIHAGGNAIQVIGNSGPVTITGNSPETPSRASNIPELLSPYFTGREEELLAIREALASPSGKSRRCAIFGVPGQGKTQLALRYATLSSENLPYVFWASGATPEKASDGFASIASLLHLQSDSQATSIELARQWLDREKQWLLVVDNISAEAVAPANNFLPKSNPGGQILVTTRTAEVARRICHIHGQKHAQIELPQLSLDECADLLHERLTDSLEVDRSQLDAVAAALGCLPLAIAQAASFMETAGKSPEDFLFTYKRESEGILSWEDGDSTYENQSFMTAVMVALERLKTTSPAAVDLLRVMSFLDPEAISVQYFHGGIDLDGEGLEDEASLERLTSLLQSETKLFTALREIERLAFAMMRGAVGGRVLWIHDLISSSVRTLMTETERETWVECAIAIVSNATAQIDDSAATESWSACRPLFSHLRCLSQYAEAENPRFLRSILNLTNYLTANGQHHEAELWNTRLFEGTTKRYGADHPNTLIAMNNLALARMCVGRVAEAEELFDQLMEASVRVLGPEDPVTTRRMANLASVYRRWGRREEALELDGRVLQLFSKILGPEAQDTLVCMCDQSITLVDLGRLREAEELAIQALETLRRVYGELHPQTLTCMGESRADLGSDGQRRGSDRADGGGLLGPRAELSIRPPSPLGAEDAPPDVEREARI